jgi:hypothetical protein
MGNDFSLSREQVEKAIRDIEGRFGSGDFESVKQDVLPIIPWIPYHSHDLRLRLYKVLVECPIVELCDPERDDLDRSTYAVIHDASSYSQETQALGLLLCNRSALNATKKENIEFGALRLANNILKDDQSTRREVIYAHRLMCRFSGDTAEECKIVAEHLQELIRFGDEDVIASACIDINTDFHIRTDYTYINRVITELNQSPFKADILIHKMRILIIDLMRTGYKSEEVKEWDDQWTGELWDTHVALLKTQTTQRQRALQEMFLAVFAAKIDRDADAIVGIHLHAAYDIASSIDDKSLHNAIRATDDYIDDILDADDRENDDDDD